MSDRRVERYLEAERAAAAQLGVAIESRAARAAGLRLRVVESGEGDPVLFVHGGGGFGSGFLPLLPHLQGVRALLLDRPGCGLSDPFSYRRDDDLRAHAVSVLEGVLDAFGLERVPVVGNSMGGLWALWLALDRPDRVSAIAQLGCPAFLDGSTIPGWMRAASVRPIGRLVFATDPPRPSQARRLIRRLGERAVVRDELAALFAAAEALPGAEESFRSMIAAYVSVRGARVPAPGAAELGRIGQPTLFVWGTSDPFGGAHLSRVMPQARHETLEAGHLPWISQPEACASLVSPLLAARAPSPGG